MHQDCCRTRYSEELPSSLVYIQRIGSDLNARIVSSPKSDGNIKYLTLSHSWGTDVFLTLKMTNLEEFHKKLPLQSPDFNCTFIEAMDVTLLLGYQYIWIDSLCIIQDSPSGVDWLSEGPRMGIIYNNCELNISASGFASSCQGMLTGQRKLVLQPRIQADDQIEYVVCYREEQTASWPLASRGWVIQEHILVSEQCSLASMISCPLIMKFRHLERFTSLHKAQWCGNVDPRFSLSHFQDLPGSLKDTGSLATIRGIFAIANGCTTLL